MSRQGEGLTAQVTHIDGIQAEVSWQSHRPGKNLANWFGQNKPHFLKFRPRVPPAGRPGNRILLSEAQSGSVSFDLCATFIEVYSIHLLSSSHSFQFSSRNSLL